MKLILWISGLQLTIILNIFKHIKIIRHTKHLSNIFKKKIFIDYLQCLSQLIILNCFFNSLFHNINHEHVVAGVEQCHVWTLQFSSRQISVWSITSTNGCSPDGSTVAIAHIRKWATQCNTDMWNLERRWEISELWKGLEGFYSLRLLLFYFLSSHPLNASLYSAPCCFLHFALGSDSKVPVTS